MHSSPKRKLLVTTALPYANGPLHLGHILEHIQSDIWVRVQKLLGHDCKFVCGEDAHGTAIMLKAKANNQSPEDVIAKFYQDHLESLTKFNIDYDNYHSTHSSENQALANEIYLKLSAQGDIEKKSIMQAFDEQEQMFLPDRYVKGTCPKCQALDQYGDHCEACGGTYAPLDLIKPYSILSKQAPIQKASLHHFFCLEKHQEFLKNWCESGTLQAEVSKKLDEWFVSGIKNWDISRDGPYFGFEIPGHPNQYFYVWLDAPIGYMASFKNLCDQQAGRLSFDEYWQAGSETELYHFIGKDIVYFHALFWPAILQACSYRLPTALYAHGYLTINGQKMSKSRGTFILAETYLQHLPSDCLRYYFAAKLGAGIEDLDFKTDDFMARINSDLVGKLINIASRLSGFVEKHFDLSLCAKWSSDALYQQFLAAGPEIFQLYTERQYAKAIRQIMALSDLANEYINSEAPWKLVKDPSKLNHAHEVCSIGLNLFRVLATYLSPVLVELSVKFAEFLNVPSLDYAKLKQPLYQHTINVFKPMLSRLEIDNVNAILSPEEQAKDNSENNTLAEIELADFAKIDLRVVKILTAEEIPEANKLLRLSVDCGNGQSKQVFAGIKSAYSCADLIGKHTLFINNLKPRKMRFGMSEGMILAAGDGKGIYLFEPDQGALPGMIVK